MLKSVEKLGSEDFLPIGILDAARSYPLAWPSMAGVPNPPFQKAVFFFFELTTLPFCGSAWLNIWGDFLVAKMT